MKARLSEYLAHVKAGEEVLVTEHGQPVARLSPVPARDAPDAHLAELERQGLIRRPTQTLDLTGLRRERSPDSSGSVLAALLAEREEGP